MFAQQTSDAKLYARVVHGLHVARKKTDRSRHKGVESQHDSNTRRGQRWPEVGWACKKRVPSGGAMLDNRVDYRVICL